MSRALPPLLLVFSVWTRELAAPANAVALAFADQLVYRKLPSSGSGGGARSHEPRQRWSRLISRRGPRRVTQYERRHEGSARDARLVVLQTRTSLVVARSHKSPVASRKLGAGSGQSVPRWPDKRRCPPAANAKRDKLWLPLSAPISVHCASGRQPASVCCKLSPAVDDLHVARERDNSINRTRGTFHLKHKLNSQVNKYAKYFPFASSAHSSGPESAGEFVCSEGRLFLLSSSSAQYRQSKLVLLQD